MSVRQWCSEGTEGALEHLLPASFSLGVCHMCRGAAVGVRKYRSRVEATF